MTLAYEIDDDVYPFTAVTFVRTTWPSGRVSTGTGFLVGPNDVLTAAHVVYSAPDGGFASRVEVIPSYDPDAYDNERFFADEWLAYTDFDPDFDGLLFSGDFRDRSVAGAEKDIALLTVNGGIGRYGWFGIDFEHYPSTSRIESAGYPGVYGNQPSWDWGTVGGSFVDNVYFNQGDLDVNPGNSGGPIYYTDDQGPTAIGLVSTGGFFTSLSDHAFWLEDAIRDNGDGSGPAADTAREVALLYEAGLDRDGDFDWSGLNYWIDVVERGSPLRDLAFWFLQSDEFERKFGEPLAVSQTNYLLDADYVDRLYLNVLDRPGEAQGRAYWLDVLARGGDRAEVLASFALSEENRRTSPHVDALVEVEPGFWAFA